MHTRKNQDNKVKKVTTPKFFKKPDDNCQVNMQQNVSVEVKLEQADDCLSSLFRCLKKAK